jgi:hypothetical protein
VKGARSGPKTFRKSTYSSDSFNCVEVAIMETEVAVRDSKAPDGSVLSYGRESWGQFIAAVKAGVIVGP